jgi:hypothetical protein
MQTQITDFTNNGALAGNFLRSNGTQLQPGFDEPVMRDTSMQGYRIAGRNLKGSGHDARVREAARLFRDVLSGQTNPFFFQQAMNPTEDIAVAWIMENYPAIFPANLRRGQYALREVMSVTDYQALFVDVIDRIYYGYFNAYPIPNMGLVKQHDLRDFRTVSRFLLDGLVTPFVAEDAAGPAPQQSLSGPVPQDGASFPTTNTAPIQYQPTLYQARASVNWRAMVNDDLGIFKDIANRLAIVANRGIHQFITKFFFSSTGLNANLFKAGFTNLITTTYGAASNNPPLSQQGLQDAFKVLAAMLDSSGQPILMSGKPMLVYGPSLKAVAENLKSSSRAFVSVEGGNQNAQGFPTQFVEAANWAMQNMELVMDPYMPIVMSAASGNIKYTAWCIVMDPEAQNRPAVEVGFLNGFKTPQLFRRQPNTMRMGGGVDETMGNFDTLDNDTKIVSVFGGAIIDGRSCVGSTGAGS